MSARRWTGRRILLLCLIILGAWYASVFTWATRPVVDHVPTGPVQRSGPSGATTVVETREPVACSAPLERRAGARAPLPELDPPRSYQRPACPADVHLQLRRLFWVDTLFSFAVAVLLTVAVLRTGGREREPHREDELVPA
jgi:hypothetical protein